MREIKFRGFNKIKNRIEKVVNIGFYDGEKLNISTDSADGQIDYYGDDIENIVLSQYTGIKDMYGKEIYEGDIIYIEDEEANFLVQWEEKTAMYVFDGIGVGLVTDFDFWYEDDLQIVGNEYENPELLGE